MDLLKKLDNMEEIPTAEEFLIRMKKMQMPISEIMKGFAKRHIKAALKEASEKAKMKLGEYDINDWYIDNNSILNAYPLDLIK